MRQYAYPPQWEIDKLKTAKDFHDYFEKIPEEFWTVGELSVDNQQLGVQQRCARGHVGTKLSDIWPETTPLADRRLTRLGVNIVGINNQTSNKFPQNNPKARVLAVLKTLIK